MSAFIYYEYLENIIFDLSDNIIVKEVKRTYERESIIQ